MNGLDVFVVSFGVAFFLASDRFKQYDRGERMRGVFLPMMSLLWCSAAPAALPQSLGAPAVKAGDTNALKVEEEGHWTAELEPTQTVVQGAQSNAEGTSMTTQLQKTRETTVSGRTYKAFWYVPEVKRWVKSVEEYYGNGGVRSESYTTELESFKLAD
jgi:hypothetical protein